MTGSGWANRISINRLSAIDVKGSRISQGVVYYLRRTLPGMARVAAGAFGAVTFAAGVTAVFATENGTGAAALITVGAALATAAILWDRVDKFELFGLSVALKSLSRETRFRAKDARRRGEEEEADRLTKAAGELKRLADNYRQRRQGAPSGPRRTGELEGVMREARETARQRLLRHPEVLAWFERGDAGAREIALGLMEGSPELRNLGAALEAIENSRSAFEQYHGLLLAAMMVVPGVADDLGVRAGPTLTPNQREDLRIVVERARSGPYVRHSNDRRPLAETIVAALED